MGKYLFVWNESNLKHFLGSMYFEIFIDIKTEKEGFVCAFFLWGGSGMVLPFSECCLVRSFYAPRNLSLQQRVSDEVSFKCPSLLMVIP